VALQEGGLPAGTHYAAWRGSSCAGCPAPLPHILVGAASRGIVTRRARPRCYLNVGIKRPRNQWNLGENRGAPTAAPTRSARTQRLSVILNPRPYSALKTARGTRCFWRFCGRMGSEAAPALLADSLAGGSLSSPNLVRPSVGRGVREVQESGGAAYLMGAASRFNSSQSARFRRYPSVGIWRP
jgi:hypothetical protein